MTFSHRSLAVVALALGLLAMAVRNPRESHRLSADLKELARIVEQEEDHVTPEELADLLMQESQQVRVVDVRDSAAFATYHIPTAVQRQISELVETSFQAQDTIVIYSDGGIHAAQAWMLLAMQGRRNVFTLRGGLNEWNDKILFPVVSATSSQEGRTRIEKRARFFGGVPMRSRTIEQPTQKPKPTAPEKKIMKEQEKLREIC